MEIDEPRTALNHLSATPRAPKRCTVSAERWKWPTAPMMRATDPPTSIRFHGELK